MSGAKTKNRLPFFDNLKGVLIILVVVGHFFNGAAIANIVPAWHVLDFIYMFHMPLFIFVSGIFCKSIYVKGERFRAGVALYYLALCWLMYLALWLPQWALGIAEPFNLLTVDASMPWYLMALAIYTVLTPLFGNLKPAFALCAAFCLSVLSGLIDVGNVLSASRVIVFLPFFLIGYYLRPQAVLDCIAKLGRRLVAARVCAAVVIVAVFVGFAFLDLEQMRFNQVIFTGVEPYAAAIAVMPESGANELVCCLVRVAGFIGTAVMGVCIMLLMPRGEVCALSRTGRHTLQVYILHAFVSYTFTYAGLAPALYAMLPAAVASIVVCACGIAVSVVLGWPNFIQEWFDRLRTALDVLTVRSKRTD